MPAGEAFSPRQRDEIVRAIQFAQEQSGLRYSVYVGAVEGDHHAYALRLLAALGRDAPRAVLVLVDPAARALEIVTGDLAGRWVDSRATALAAMTMTSSFAAGDLHGGIVHGLHGLAEHARRPRSLHTEQV